MEPEQAKKCHERLDAATIISGLDSLGLAGFGVQVLDEVTSTNTVAADRISGLDAPNGGFLVTAELQTAGRGRLDRQWESPSGAGIALTIALPETEFPAEHLSLVPLAVGLAVRDAVSAFGLDVALKWPNDVVLVGPDGLRKLSGILVQRHSGWIITGVGVNVSLSREQLPIPTATSLYIEGIDASRNDLIPAIVNGFKSRVASLGTLEFLADYSAACCTIGQEVRVEGVGGSMVCGRAEGLTEDGALLVRIEDGPAVAINSGDVVHVR